MSRRRPSAAWYNAGDATLHPRRRGRRGPPSQRRDRLEAAADTAAETAADTVAEAAAEPPPAPRRRGRSPGSKNRPKPAPADLPAGATPAGLPAPTDVASDPSKATADHGGAAAAGAAAPRRRGRPPGRTARATTPAVARRDRLSIEQIVAVESPREPRLSPDGRRVAFTAEAAGARQVFVLDLRSGQTRPGHRLRARRRRSPVVAATARGSPTSARRPIWIVGTDGSRPALVADHPAGQRSPRWAPDGRRLALISRRRGWNQPGSSMRPCPAAAGRRRARCAPSRGRSRRSASTSRTSGGRPDGSRIAFVAQRDADLSTMQVTVVEVATGEERIVAGNGAWETSPRWLPDGSGLLVVSRPRRLVPGRAGAARWWGPHRPDRRSCGARRLQRRLRGRAAPIAGRHAVRPSRIHDGLVDLFVAPLAGGRLRERRPGRPPRNRPPEVGGRRRADQPGRRRLARSGLAARRKRGPGRGRERAGSRGLLDPAGSGPDGTPPAVRGA